MPTSTTPSPGQHFPESPFRPSCARPCHPAGLRVSGAAGLLGCQAAEVMACCAHRLLGSTADCLYRCRHITQSQQHDFSQCVTIAFLAKF